MRIVLTGGPCAGKTSLIEKFRNDENIYIIPEIATILFQEEYPAPDPWSQEWQNAFQAAVVKRQLEEEEKIPSDIPNVIFDRGLLDGSAYIPGDSWNFANKFKLDYVSVLKRYDMIIHLRSLAWIDPLKYEELKSTNPSRFENVQEALDRDKKTIEAWKDHKCRIVPHGSLTEIEKYIRSIVS